MPSGDAVAPLIFETPVQPLPKMTAEPVKKGRKLRLPTLPWRRVMRRKVLIPAAIAVLGFTISGGAYAGVQYARTQASPDTIYGEALSKALMTKQVMVMTQSSTGQSNTKLDLTTLKSPRISSDMTATIAGSSFHFQTYGSTSDTYIAYKTLPEGIANSTVAAVTNNWVQLRKGGVLPAAINTALSNAADPRYQAFGPVVFANLPPKTSQIIAKFLVDHKVYGYDLAKVKTVPLGTKKALLFSGTFNADYSKLATQSVATSEGFSIVDVQRIVNTLNSYKGASSDLYIDTDSHLPIRLVLKTKAGQTVTYDYSDFNAVHLAAQPSSKIEWPQFATTQLQIESQASALQTTEQRDLLRQNSLAALQFALAKYHDQHAIYPSLANLNNQTWLAINMPSFDPDTTRDPQASTLALLASAPAINPAVTNAKAKAKPVVAATPIYGYIYQATNDAGKVCINETDTPVDQLCTHYNLTATLSSGKPYNVTSP
jgi:hypothetical protein